MEACPTADFEQYLKQLRAGGPAVGGPGGAWPYPLADFKGLPYGCPDDCIGDHEYGLISLRGMDGVEDDGTILAGATASITVLPQKRNQPRRLYLSEEMVNNFIGLDLVIGVEPVFASKVPFGLAQWQANSRVRDFRRIICEVSQTVVLQVRNISGAARPFISTMEAYMVR